MQVDQQNDQDKAKELAMTASNIDLKSLRSLIDRYSPKQILHDRTRKANRIPLRLRLLFTCFYVKAAIGVVKTVDEESSTSNNETTPSDHDKLSDILGVDARSGLPHPLWTRKHDAILIRSVAKHGWVDVDSNLKDIVNDKDITWGFPFEASNNAPIQQIGDQGMNNIRATAERAAAILNDKKEVLEALPGFNKKLGKFSTMTSSNKN